MTVNHSHLGALRERLRSAARGNRRRAYRLIMRFLAPGVALVVFLGAAMDGTGAAQSLTPTPTRTPTSIPTATSRAPTTVPINVVGGFITGTVWDDTPKRNALFDDNEDGLSNVAIIVERIDAPSLITTCISAIPPNVNPTGRDGRYRCDGLTEGLYRVSVDPPRHYEATTSLQAEVFVSEAQGAVVDFGLAREDRRNRAVGGIVFLDCNQNGIRDLPVEFANGPDSGYEIRLERVGGRGGEKPSTRRENRYSFEELDTGTYIVNLRLTGARFRATTSTRVEVDAGTTESALVDFGLYDTRLDSECERSANATATVATGATATVAARLGTTPTVPSQSNGAATAATPVATATVAATPTPAVASTPSPSEVLDRAYPRTARFLMQAVTNPRGPNRIDMLAEGILIGTEDEVVTSDGRRVGTEQISMRIRRNERLDDIVVTASEAYRRSAGEAAWRAVPYEEIRNELGPLVPFDAITALRCVTRATEDGRTVLDGVVARMFFADVDALRLWETSVRPRYTGRGGVEGPGGQAGGATSGPRSSVSVVGGTLPGGGTRPLCTPPAAVRAEPNRGAAYAYQTVQLQAWIGVEDGKIRAERFTARVMPPVSDPADIPDTLEFEAVLTFWDVNLPITIVPPILADNVR